MRLLHDNTRVASAPAHAKRRASTRSSTCYTGPRRWGHSMNDKPRTGRILRNLRQVEAEDLERMAQFDECVEEMRRNGCADPEDPAELAKWQAEQDREFEENARLHRAFEQMEREEEEELRRIKDSRPLGVPPPIEPRSVHSAVPQPPWKRKLRP